MVDIAFGTGYDLMEIYIYIVVKLTRGENGLCSKKPIINWPNDLLEWTSGCTTVQVILQSPLQAYCKLPV